MWLREWSSLQQEQQETPEMNNLNNASTVSEQRWDHHEYSTSLEPIPEVPDEGCTKLDVLSTEGTELAQEEGSGEVESGLVEEVALGPTPDNSPNHRLRAEPSQLLPIDALAIERDGCLQHCWYPPTPTVALHHQPMPPSAISSTIDR